MSETLPVPVSSLTPIEHLGRRVVTFAMIDAVHGRVEGTARRNFAANRSRLVEGEDYFLMNLNEFRTSFPGIAPARGGGEIALIAESGYMMLVKSMTDDLAWDVQRELVNTYFSVTHVRRVSRSTPVHPLLAAAKLIPQFVRAMRACGLDKNVAAISSNQMAAQVTGANFLQSAGHGYIDTSDQEQYFNASELIDGVSGIKMNKMLAAAGLHEKIDGLWVVSDLGKSHSRSLPDGNKL